jgi:hypothetical protein
MNLFSRFRISVLVLALPGALALTGFSQEPPPAREAPPPAAEKATPPPADTPPVEAPKEDDRANLRRVGEPIPDANEPSKRIRSRQRNGGDQFPLGDHTISRGRRTREVVSFLGSTLVEGEVDSDVGSIGGRTTIASGASVGGAAVAGRSTAL